MMLIPKDHLTPIQTYWLSLYSFVKPILRNVDFTHLLSNKH